jgi:hypothetical protein
MNPSFCKLSSKRGIMKAKRRSTLNPGSLIRAFKRLSQSDVADERTIGAGLYAESSRNSLSDSSAAMPPSKLDLLRQRKNAMAKAGLTLVAQTSQRSLSESLRGTATRTECCWTTVGFRFGPLPVLPVRVTRNVTANVEVWCATKNQWNVLYIYIRRSEFDTLKCHELVKAQFYGYRGWSLTCKQTQAFRSRYKEDYEVLLYAQNIIIAIVWLHCKRFARNLCQ